MLKKEIRERVIGGLVEQGVITLTEQLEAVPLSSSSTETESGPSAETPSDAGKVYLTGEYSPQSSAGNIEARLKVRLTRLQLEARERETHSQLQHQLEMRKAELQAETERAVRLRQLELEASNKGQSAPRDSDDKEEKKAAESSLLPVQDASAEHTPPTGPELPLAGGAAFPVSRERLSQMQEADPTLRECFAKVWFLHNAASM
ncbi:hypothetical protein JOB18_009021 [Solea senegalensis]|uniref:Uncharacterized protein n=1 Tax=Solea senegalensis TaxID=28829 RepID=A0AAV6S736_SOLSE|nr:hypothetical protein JOB18_009021 [Solea senegalensis]